VRPERVASFVSGDTGGFDVFCTGRSIGNGNERITSGAVRIVAFDHRLVHKLLDVLCQNVTANSNQTNDIPGYRHRTNQHNNHERGTVLITVGEASLYSVLLFRTPTFMI
jgi:hypothetical protein